METNQSDYENARQAASADVTAAIEAIVSSFQRVEQRYRQAEGEIDSQTQRVIEQLQNGVNRQKNDE